MSKKDGFGHEKPNEGQTNDWITPEWIITAFNERVDDLFFDLDPCSSLTQPWILSKKAFTEEQNGLKQKWFGTVYCNPPYGQNVGVWANKMAEHGDGIMLIFARIETGAWFDEIFTTADGYLFPKGRIAFYEFVCECGAPRSLHLNPPKGFQCPNFVNTGKAVRGHEAGAPSALVAWGGRSRSALIEICDKGMLDDKGILRSSAFFDRAFYTGSRRW